MTGLLGLTAVVLLALLLAWLLVKAGNAIERARDKDRHQ